MAVDQAEGVQCATRVAADGGAQVLRRELLPLELQRRVEVLAAGLVAVVLDVDAQGRAGGVTAQTWRWSMSWNGETWRTFACSPRITRSSPFARRT